MNCCEKLGWFDEDSNNASDLYDFEYCPFCGKNKKEIEKCQ